MRDITKQEISMENLYYKNLKVEIGDVLDFRNLHSVTITEEFLENNPQLFRRNPGMYVGYIKFTEDCSSGFKEGSVFPYDLENVGTNSIRVIFLNKETGAEIGGQEMTRFQYVISRSPACTKKDFIKYAKEVGIPLDGNPNITTDDINEVLYGDVEAVRCVEVNDNNAHNYTKGKVYKVTSSLSKGFTQHIITDRNIPTSKPWYKSSSKFEPISIEEYYKESDERAPKTFRDWEFEFISTDPQLLNGLKKYNCRAYNVAFQDYVAKELNSLHPPISKLRYAVYLRSNGIKLGSLEVGEKLLDSIFPILDSHGAAKCFINIFSNTAKDAANN